MGMYGLSLLFGDNETLALPLIMVLSKAADVVEEGEGSSYTEGESDSEPLSKAHLLWAWVHSSPKDLSMVLFYPKFYSKVLTAGTIYVSFRDLSIQ